LVLDPRFDTTWVIIERGTNQFIMSPYLTEKINQWVRSPVVAGKGIIKNMTAEEFNVKAKENGGLVAAAKAFEASQDEDFKRHRVQAEQWLQHLLAKNKPEGVAGPKYEFWKRVNDAYDVNNIFKLAAGFDYGGEEDEWEDEDEDD
jgi:hypothetical protein